MLSPHQTENAMSSPKVTRGSTAFTRVMHPVEPIQVRFTLRYSFG